MYVLTSGFADPLPAKLDVAVMKSDPHSSVPPPQTIQCPHNELVCRLVVYLHQSTAILSNR